MMQPTNRHTQFTVISFAPLAGVCTFMIGPPQVLLDGSHHPIDGTRVRTIRMAQVPLRVFERDADRFVPGAPLLLPLNPDVVVQRPQVQLKNCAGTRIEAFVQHGLLGPELVLKRPTHA